MCQEVPFGTIAEKLQKLEALLKHANGVMLICGDRTTSALQHYEKSYVFSKLLITFQ